MAALTLLFLFDLLFSCWSVNLGACFCGYWKDGQRARILASATSKLLHYRARCETDPYLGRASPSNGVCSHAGSNDLLPAKLKEVLYDNQFEQHWLQAENDRQVVGFGAEMVTDETYGFRGWNWPFTTTSPKGKELAQSKEVSLFWSGMAEVRYNKSSSVSTTNDLFPLF
ncbi:hypothetical protein Tco_0992460 [Tanacetum coccineum]|uniref:Uncharacterized protein n=1 Tax=Tanacetum coccineum TaxID=301880 RepID=A0ABQ5F256_9ASTR